MKEKKEVLREVAQEDFQARDEREWYESKVKTLSQRSKPSQFYLAFSGAARKTSKAPLLLARELSYARPQPSLHNFH